jgi:MFS family permease
VVRPLIGRLTDAIGPRKVLLLGVAILSLSGLGYLVPALAVLLLVRVVHGIGWAAFNTGALASIATLAPATRRGEASGVYNVMPGIAQLVFPGLGILVAERAGLPVAFALSGAIAFAGVLIIGASPRTAPVARPQARSTYFDRAWLLPTTLEFLNSTCLILILAFPPVFALHKGIEFEELAIYYPLYGVVVVAVRLLARTYFDQVDRRLTISAAALVGIAGLGVGALAESVGLLTVSACMFGAATAVISPSTMALAIDRAGPGTAGAAMATYSMGIQLGLGVGAFTWGVFIDAFGFPSPYLGAIATYAVLLTLALAANSRPSSSPASI